MQVDEARGHDQPAGIDRLAGLAGGLVLALAAGGSPLKAEESLRVMSFGSSYQEAQRKSQFKPFE